MVSRRIEEKQTAGQALIAGWHRWLDAERAHLPLWLPVALAAGIALWFALPWAPWRQAAACAAAALAIGFLLAGLRPLAWMALLLLAGLGVSELRVALNHHPVLAGRVFATVTARVESAEPLAFGDQRLVLVPAAGHSLPGGTQRLRLRLRGDQPQVAAGTIISARALLSPPSGMAVPGGYDLARRAWFDGIGGTGVALGQVAIVAAPPPGPGLWLAGVRSRLQALITSRMPGEAGAVAAAFVTGWQGAIPPATAQAMRDAGLAHLLSISGLHIAVVVGSVALMIRWLLGLWPWLVLRVPVPTLALAAGALAGPAFALGAAGGLWLALWRSRARWWGLAPLAGAVLLAWSAAVPDLLISSDGRHLALRLPDGRLAHSRERVGDFLIDNWAEAVGSDPASAVWLGTLPLARCSAESCVADVERDGRRWRVLATTGRSLIPRDRFAPACAAADIVVSDRRLPDWCQPRWLKLDAAALAHTGAVAIWLDARRVTTAADAAGDRPWQPH
ncbi:ComEC/Rec2 family competence protein [Sandarakinorhabdus limnophila]|uniref:ComEC/Rec2 family competence protein n=1 Tax=Sandarakinorhabdus limnophila TaxID=210512 RepID=UPI0004093B8B|nr:ComEC/Rec2 family competence protein [Sandarakinorhabdus limnophila]